MVSPVCVVLTLGNLIQQASFWQSIINSLLHIGLGFIIALLASSVCAILSSLFKFIEYLLYPLVVTIKSVPIVSFIILILVWVKPNNLSIIISFLMVFPLVYINILEGIKSSDIKLLEMAQVFNLSFLQRVTYIYIPEVLPYFKSACSMGLGLCWKAGIAAEVIALPSLTIGASLYDSKIYFDIPELFAWTLVIIIISIFFEKVFKKLLSLAFDR